MSKNTNDDLTLSDTGCFIAVYPYGKSGRQRVNKVAACRCLGLWRSRCCVNYHDDDVDDNDDDWALHGCCLSDLQVHSASTDHHAGHHLLCGRLSATALHRSLSTQLREGQHLARPRHPTRQALFVEEGRLYFIAFHCRPSFMYLVWT